MSKVRFDEGLLRFGQTHGKHDVMVDDRGEYSCYSCGYRWMSSRRIMWWPVHVSWRRGRAWQLSTHAIEIPSHATAIEQRVYRRIVHVGPIRITFGDRRVSKPSVTVLNDKEVDARAEVKP